MILPFFRTLLPSSKTSYYLYYSLCYILIYILKIVFAFNAKGPVKSGTFYYSEPNKNNRILAGERV
jgi:hypothetical protein